MISFVNVLLWPKAPLNNNNNNNILLQLVKYNFICIGEGATSTQTIVFVTARIVQSTDISKYPPVWMIASTTGIPQIKLHQSVVQGARSRNL